MANETAPLPDRLTVVAYPDPVVEAHGFGPDHPYIEAAVVAVVGPSATLMWRRLARQVIAADPAPVALEVADLLACLGLGAGTSRNSVGARTLGRMVGFGLARRAGRDGSLLAVRRAVAPHPQRFVERLAPTARAEHHRLTARPTARPAGTPAARLAPAGRLPLGQLSVTPAAVAVMAATATDPADLLHRHRHGDWGDITPTAAADNDAAVETGELVHSEYTLAPGITVWVLTDGDRRHTHIIEGQP